MSRPGIGVAARNGSAVRGPLPCSPPSCACASRSPGSAARQTIRPIAFRELATSPARRLLRPGPRTDVDLPRRLVGGQRDLGAVEDNRLEHVGGEVVVAPRGGGALGAVPVIAPEKIDGAVAAGDVL